MNKEWEVKYDDIIRVESAPTALKAAEDFCDWYESKKAAIEGYKAYSRDGYELEVALRDTDAWQQIHCEVRVVYPAFYYDWKDRGIWERVKSIPVGTEIPLKTGSPGITIIDSRDGSPDRIWYTNDPGDERTCHKETMESVASFIEGGGSIKLVSDIKPFAISEDHYNLSYAWAILRHLAQV